MKADLEEIVDQYLSEILRTLAQEAGRNIRYTLVDVDNTSCCVNGVVKTDSGQDEATVEMRITRRSAERPTRFTVQAVTRELSPESGYSGFIAQGRLADPSGVEIIGYTNTYNVFYWEDKLSKV